MKLLEICQQLPDVDISEFQRFTSKWISYVRSSTKSNNISEMEWNLFFSQTNPVAGIDRGAMQDQNKEKNGYRERNERRSFVSNWDKTILPILKEIINPDSENRIEKIKNVRNTVRNIIVQGGGRNTKAAINRMLITFCPDILIRIPNEDNTKEFIDLLKPFFDSEEPLVKEEDWIDNSFQIMKFLKKQLGETIHRRTLWDLYTHLKNSDYKSNMNKEKRNANMLDKYVSLLETNKNLILTGAPGTGKTYMAREIAKELIMSKVRHYKDYTKDDNFENITEIEEVYNRILEDHCKMVQFHPSLDYTDFVEGLRPVKGHDSQLGFERKNGVFKDFCERALSFVVTKRKGDGSIIESDVTISGHYDLYNDCYDAAIQSLKQLHSLKTSYGNLYGFSVKGNSILFDETQWVDYSSESFLFFYDSGITDYDVFNKDFPQSIEEIEEFLIRHVKEGENALFEETRKNYSQDIDLKKIAESYWHLFVWIYKYAKSNYERIYLPSVFFIDEINRGEISKIFGELFFSIDPGYRGEKGRVCTQYQNMIEDGDVFKEGFYVPENVYIIGTMNDIDRSVESMDFAMRRRFVWKEITPDDTAYMLDTLDCAVEAKATMNRLNKVIEDTDGLGAAYMIGPAYFLKLAKNGGDFNKLWEMNIEPLLKEYLRGFRKAKEILDKFSKAYFNKIDED